MGDHLTPRTKLAGFDKPRTYWQDLPYLIGAAAALFLLIDWSI